RRNYVSQFYRGRGRREHRETEPALADAVFIGRGDKMPFGHKVSVDGRNRYPRLSRNQRNGKIGNAVSRHDLHESIKYPLFSLSGALFAEETAIDARFSWPSLHIHTMIR